MKRTGENLGQRIARLRGRVSQIAFAERAGLSRRTIQNIEDGTTTSPGIDNLRQIAAALEMSVSDLIGEEKAIPRALIGRLIESGDLEDPFRVASLLLEQFANAPPRLRAVVLAYLFQDFEIMRKYHREIASLMPKPK